MYNVLMYVYTCIWIQVVYAHIVAHVDINKCRDARTISKWSHVRIPPTPPHPRKEINLHLGDCLVHASGLLAYFKLLDQINKYGFSHYPNYDYHNPSYRSITWINLAMVQNRKARSDNGPSFDTAVPHLLAFWQPCERPFGLAGVTRLPTNQPTIKTNK